MGSCVNHPPQSEKIIEVAMVFTSEGGTFHGGQDKLPDARKLSRVEEAAVEEQTHLCVGARLQENLTSIKRSLKRRHKWERWPRPLILT
jgi:hypothetical protein